MDLKDCTIGISCIYLCNKILDSTTYFQSYFIINIEVKGLGGPRRGGEACVDELEVEPIGRRRGGAHPRLAAKLDRFLESFDLNAIRVGLSPPVIPTVPLPVTQIHPSVVRTDCIFKTLCPD